MKIKTIMCNASQHFFDIHAEIRRQMSNREIEILVTNLENGPYALESAVDDVIAGPYILRQVIQSEHEGCDAVVIDCAADPVVRAAREATSLPVVSAGEASYLTAMLLCDKFSVITTLEATTHIIKENIKKYGISDRIASVRTVAIPVNNLDNIGFTLETLVKESNDAINQDKAEAIVLGCTGMMLVSEKLRQKIEVPVIEPLTVAVQLAAVLVRAGLTSSQLTYGRVSKNNLEILNKIL